MLQFTRGVGVAVGFRKLLKFSLMFWIAATVTQNAQALRAPDMSGNDNGAVVVYDFNEVGGESALDTSAVGSPLNLIMSSEGNLPTGDGTIIRTNALLQSGYLVVNPKPNGSEPDQGYQLAQRHRTFLASESAAAKLNTCTTGFTVQGFIRPWFPFQGSDDGNLIIGISNSENQTDVKTPNFGVYQSGQNGSEAIMLKVRTANGSARSQVSAPGAFSSTRELDNPGQLTEFIATMEANGILTVYVNRIARSSLTGVTPAFLASGKLVIGNELVPLTLGGNGMADVSQQRNWSGEIYHLAIYCRGFSRAEILGDSIGFKARADVVRPQATADTPSRQQARKLVERLIGISVPLDHPMVARVETRLAANDWAGAAKIVTGDIASGEAGHPEFLNNTVKLFAMKMSNREETIRAPFNDMAASFIGVTRDERNAQELLTGDFYYMADPAKANVRSDLLRDLLVSGNHYQDIENGQWDIGRVLKRVEGQKMAVDPTGGTTEHPDPAGVLTSRAFMGAHAIAGTNRRLVEYAFREFMCMPMANMADTSGSPARIGRDVDRMPGGDGTKFETNCKGCHSVMDGYRGAFAKFDFATITFNNTSYSFVRNTQINTSGAFGFKNNEVDGSGTVRKMNHNENVFPTGFQITDDSFVNNAVGTANASIFGWGGSNKIGGTGVNQFGRMISESQRFSQCMANRAFQAVCAPHSEVNSTITPAVAEIAAKFRASGYKLKSLFQDVAINPACIQQMGR